MRDTDADVIYHGRVAGSGEYVIAVETPSGEDIGQVPHVARHSPTGMSWGYEGAGAADTARSLLIAALGAEAAQCSQCRGTCRIVFDPATGVEKPYDLTRAAAYDNEQILHCMGCQDGICALPYQAFKREHVARWGSEWRMSRAAVVEWLRNTQA